MNIRRLIKGKEGEYLCYGDEHLSENLARDGSWEAGLISCAEKYLNDESHILDIGANLGTWTIALAKGNRFVHAFEPLDTSFYALCGNVFLNKKEKNVKLYHCAVTDDLKKNLTVDIINPSNISGTIVRENKEGQVGGCSVITIDSLDLKKCDFIKIDVEGHEIYALKGAENTIKKFKPVIFFECWWQRSDFRVQTDTLMKYITSLGYKINHQSAGHGDDFEAIPI